MKSIRVTAAVIRDKDRIFATQKGYGNYKGWWEFPGGKIEQGETAEQALVREIKEELDTEIEVGVPHGDGLFLVHRKGRSSCPEGSRGCTLAGKGRALVRQMASCGL